MCKGLIKLVNYPFQQFLKILPLPGPKSVVLLAMQVKEIHVKENTDLEDKSKHLERKYSRPSNPLLFGVYGEFWCPKVLVIFCLDVR